MKPYSEFQRHSVTGHLRSICRDYINIRRKETRHGDPGRFEEYQRRYHDKMLPRVVSFLRYFWYGQGVCLICGELQPLYLENHHAIPEDEMIVSLCANCHRKHHSWYQDRHMITILNAIENSKFLWDSDGQPKGLKPVPMWTADLPLKEAIEILKSYDLPGYEPVVVEV